MGCKRKSLLVARNMTLGRGVLKRSCLGKGRVGEYRKVDGRREERDEEAVRRRVFGIF